MEIATAGLLALRWRGTQMIVREEDVRSKKEVEGQLMVELSPDANIMLRTENVVRASGGGSSCSGSGCGGGAADGAGTSAMMIGDNGTFPDPFDPNYECHTEWQQVMTHCHWVEIGCQRFWMCIPETRQVTVCRHKGSIGIT
jgi:hypothetical protein